MSNGETTTIPSGNATITLTPGDQTKIYQHQGRYIVATIQMPLNTDIPDGATIDFTQGNSQHSSGFLALPDEPDWTAVPIVPNPADKTKGEARLGIRYDTTDTSNTITVYAQASGKWSPVQAPTAAGPVTYTVVTTDPTVTLTPPDNALLTAPDKGNDQLAPSGNDKSTAHFSCTVVDDQNHPIPDFIVDWHEAGAKSVGLFSYQVNAYTTLADNYNARLTDAIQGGLLEDTDKGGYYVRMVTNAQGVADLYLVARGTAGTYVSGLMPVFDYSELTSVPSPFLVYDPNESSLPGSSPVITDEKGWTDHTSVGTLNFDTMTYSPFVQATVQAYQNYSASDQIYLTCNGKIVAGPASPTGKAWESWTATFIDAFCYSNTGPNAGDKNVVQIFVATGNGELKISEKNQFTGTGSTQQTSIPNGPLKMPVFYPDVGYINYNLIKNDQPLGVVIDLDSQPKYAGWTPQPGDRLTAVAYMRGWKQNGYVEAVGSTATTPKTLAAGETTGNITLYFPSDDPFRDWDSQLAAPHTQGECLVVYAVQPKGTSVYNQLYSEVLYLVLNTARKS
jgi:hypothetical protein